MAAPSNRPVPELASSRYELILPLGKGGAGAVFLALDRETGEEVALKKLFRVDARSVQRFKREFRALADLHHPNLVKLYDLQRADDAWFLTMEYVDGNDIQTELTRDFDPASVPPPSANDNDPALSPARIARIASAFHQLALGVQAVHRAGMLHRDLKPTNVVVAKSGRVVVLDFGLVHELGMVENPATQDGTVAGTPAYMAPEQATARELTPASDWYSFGVMLYETLSGFLPIEARSAVVLVQRKMSEDPQPLSAALGPQGLAELCTGLLARDPLARPSAEAILAVLEPLAAAHKEQPLFTATEEQSFQSDTIAPTARSELFGREAEVAKLYEALDYVRDNRSATVYVRGTSGAGKTSLIEYFLDDLQDSQSTFGRQSVVLRSRCYEREAMPFKALDGVIDALVGHLSTLDDFELAHCLPSEIHALTQVFPSFERLRVVATLMTKGRDMRGDAAQLRRSAERALRELFINVAKRLTLVLWIDDLQWGDLDSATVLQDFLKRPVEAPILIVLSYRSDEVETSSCLRQLVPTTADASPVAPRFELSVNALRDADIERLCVQRLGSDTGVKSLTERIVAEAHGNPFLALQLTALAQAKLDNGAVDLSALSVDELVLRMSALLAEPARALLRVLAIAGRPLVPQLALGAAGVLRDGRSHIHALHGLRLLRTRIVEGVRLLEVYHDRVREAIGASLSAAESQHLHERILRTVETGGQSEPAWLHALAFGAGQRALALRYGQLAAQIASSSLAFERAAELYARCLTLTDVREEQGALWNKLGLALARCRRGAEAANAYLKASEFAAETERTALLQLAASHLVRSGSYEEGERLVQRVMQALQIEVPSSRAGMYAAIAWERARRAFLARSVKPKADIPLPADEFRRGEFYGLVAVWTAAHTPLRAALFQARAVRMAFQYGEATQMARTLCLSATVECISGTEAAANRVEAHLNYAERLSAMVNHPNLRVELVSSRATCALLLGRLRDAIEPACQADELYDKKSAFDDTGDYYHMFGLRTVRIAALQGLGRHKEAMPILRELVGLARATDNITTILHVSHCVAIMEQVLDICSGSRERLDWERTRLPNGETGMLHVMHMNAVLRAASMTRDFDWAQRVIAELWPGFEASPVRRASYLSYVLHGNLARFLLNRYVLQGESGDPERVVRHSLRFLSSAAPEPLRAPASARVRARIALIGGDKKRAREIFQASLENHQKIGAADDVARERYALGCLSEGAEGEELKRDACSLLANCGIVNPEADLRAFYPELFPRTST